MAFLFGEQHQPLKISKSMLINLWLVVKFSWKGKYD